MAARSKARKRAVDVLYEADLRGVDPLTTLAEKVALGEPPVRDYTIELVEGTATRLPAIDAILGEYAVGWTVGRMPDVDRAVLRLGVFELLWRDDVPPAVAIDEAVELARTLSTDESPAFVNGVLGRVQRDGPPAAAMDLPLPPAAGPPGADGSDGTDGPFDGADGTDGPSGGGAESSGTADADPPGTSAAPPA